MAHFTNTFEDSTPFGRNEYRFSDEGLQFSSATIAKDTVPTEVIDGSTQKILQAGEVLARITSGPNAGKVGPYSTDTAGVTDGRSDSANIVGVNDTFLPWHLLERDVEIAVCYAGTLVQPKVTVRDAAGKRVSANDTVAAKLVAQKSISITFRG